MELFQILDCSSIGTCCKDYSLVMVLDISRKIFELIQLVVPIVLIVGATIQLVQMVVNPDMKDGIKKLINKVLAALIVLLLPTLIDIVFEAVIPDTISVASCWRDAKSRAANVGFNNGHYVNVGGETIFLRYGENNPSINVAGSGSSSVGAGTGEGSALGRSIVAYANQFVGKTYQYGGVWNGELPYTPTDCSGFVSGVYKHFGIHLYPQTEVMWNDRSKYTLVTSGNIKAGDLVMYNGHVAMLTGNGNEIIHAKCTRCGIVKESNYARSSKFRGIMRINGVN